MLLWIKTTKFKLFFFNFPYYIYGIYFFALVHFQVKTLKLTLCIFKHLTQNQSILNISKKIKNLT